MGGVGGYNPLLIFKRSQSEYGGGVGVLWRWECEGQVTENGSFSSPHPLTRISQNPPPPKGQRSVTLTPPHPQPVLSSSICTAPILMQTSFVVIFDRKSRKVWSRRSNLHPSFFTQTTETNTKSSPSRTYGLVLLLGSSVLVLVALVPQADWSTRVTLPNGNHYFTFDEAAERFHLNKQHQKSSHSFNCF